MGIHNKQKYWATKAKGVKSDRTGSSGSMKVKKNSAMKRPINSPKAFMRDSV